MLLGHRAAHVNVYFIVDNGGTTENPVNPHSLYRPGWDRRRRPSDDDDDDENGVENQRSWLHSMALANVAARSAAPQASRPRRDAPLAAARAARPVRLRPKADLDARGGPEAQPPQPQESKSVPPQAARLRRDASIDAARAAARPVLRPRPKADRNSR